MQETEIGSVGVQPIRDTANRRNTVKIAGLGTVRPAIIIGTILLKTHSATTEISERMPKKTHLPPSTYKPQLK